MMKSVQEETATAFTAPKKKFLKWPAKWKKRLKSSLSTETGLSFVIACLSVIVITVLLSSRYLNSEGLIYAEISSRDVYADKLLHVEDKDETTRSRYEARESVAPIYKTEPGADKVIMERLVDYLEDISEIRNRSDMSYVKKREALQKLLVGNESGGKQDLAEIILNSPNWHHIYEISVASAESLVGDGVRSDEFRNRKEQLIRQSFPNNHHLSPVEENVVVSLVASRLRPTLMIDAQSTEQARSIAASRIKPVIETYNKDDLIVKKGDRITDLQRSALQSQGTLPSKNPWLAVIGVVVLSFSLLSIVWIYLYQFEHSNFFKPAYAGLVATILVTTVLGLAVLIDLNATLVVTLFPIAIMSLMLCIFTHPRIAILTTMITLLLCGLTLKIPLDSLSVLVISSLVGIFILARKPVPKDRNDLILAGLGVGVSRGIVILATSFIYEPVLDTMEFSLFFRFWLGVLSGIFTGILTLGVLPLFESMFKLVTSYTLLELGNHDRPLLRRMQMEAPGTFHHSLMVASLSESAAEAIGANPILARVGALYHDIGKMKRPLFFVENQAYFGVENPHDKLTPRLSKMVVTAHPRDGIEMGKQLGLPKVIMRFMPEHHGTLIAGYFYNKAVLEEGEENVNKSQFRYPGPKPQSKETAIVMLADACESSVRALKNPTVAQVEERVDKIIKQRVEDNQFTECSITFQDIQTVRETFVRILRGIQHNRIEYQQNVLEELGKKPLMDSTQQVSQNLTTVQTRNTAGNGGGKTGSGEPLIELDSLTAEQKEAQEMGPGCC